MNLHLDRDAFRVLIEIVSEKTGYRSDVLEKDYYVVLILEELAVKQSSGLPAFFKGGTALYKALRATNRFSELLRYRSNMLYSDISFIPTFTYST